jgi:hypothetical protein
MTTITRDWLEDDDEEDDEAPNDPYGDGVCGA